MTNLFTEQKVSSGVVITEEVRRDIDRMVAYLVLLGKVWDSEQEAATELHKTFSISFCLCEYVVNKAYEEGLIELKYRGIFSQLQSGGYKHTYNPDNFSLSMLTEVIKEYLEQDGKQRKNNAGLPGSPGW